MKSSKRIFFTIALIAMSFFFYGCAAITFFPTASAQKAADYIIDEVWPASQPTILVITVDGNKKTAPSPVMTPK